MKSKIFLSVICSICFITTVSCEDAETSVAEHASTDQERVGNANNTEAPNQDKEQFYTITNDFQDYRGGGAMYVLLTSVNIEKTYIIPPTIYGPLELEYVVMEEAKVDGECVKVPASAFPLAVHICQSQECSQARSLDIILKNPAHYNISGIGGFLAPHIYPVSPCSKEFVDLMKNVGEYKEL